MELNKFVISGDVYMCDYGEQVGSVQSGIRPCVIIDNPKACAYSPIIHCCPLTTEHKKSFPLHYTLFSKDYLFLTDDSIVLCEQYGLIDKSQLMIKIGTIGLVDLYKITEMCKHNLPY